MTERIEKPRCPVCGHCQADWILEGQFTCKHGHPPVTFIIGEGFVTILTNLNMSVVHQFEMLER